MVDGPGVVAEFRGRNRRPRESKGSGVSLFRSVMNRGGAVRTIKISMQAPRRQSDCGFGVRIGAAETEGARMTGPLHSELVECVMHGGLRTNNEVPSLRHNWCDWEKDA